MMETHTKEPTKVLTQATRDEYVKFRYDLGSCLAKIPIEMIATQNASFLVDDKAKWNARHGTIGKTLPPIPAHPGFGVRTNTSFDRDKNKREQRVFTLCENLRTQGLDYVDAVFPGQFNTVKEHGAFALNYTLQKAFAHLAKNLHFEITTKKKYPTLMEGLKIPYDPIAGPGPYFEQLIKTQVAIKSLGPLYEASATDAVLVLNALTAIQATYDEKTLVMANHKWDAIDGTMQTTPQYQTTIFDAFQTFWMKELIVLQGIAAPKEVRANLAEVTEEQELASARLNQQAETIAALSAEVANLRHNQAPAPYSAPIPDDLQTVLSNLTSFTTKLAAGT
jgi:hypothetical protein